MNEFLKEALEKIDKGMKEKLDRYGDAMKADVMEGQVARV